MLASPAISIYNVRNLYRVQSDRIISLVMNHFHAGISITVYTLSCVLFLKPSPFQLAGPFKRRNVDNQIFCLLKNLASDRKHTR